MKTLLFGFLLWISSGCAYAQLPVVEWQKSLGGSGEDRAYSAKQTKDGGYIVAGVTNSLDGDVKGRISSDDYWVVKLTATGLIQWQRPLGSFSADWGAFVTATEDSGCLVSGFIRQADGNVSYNHGEPGTLDCWLVKLDKAGTIQWERSFGGTGNDGNAYDGPALCTRQTTDGGYIMATCTWSSDGDLSGNHGAADYWIVKTDDTGHIQWQKNFGGSEYDIARSIRQTKDNGYIVIGQSRSSDGDVDMARGNDDYWVLKLDESGNIQWQKSYGGSESDVGNDILQTADGGYMMTGYSSSADGDVTGHHYSADYWVVRIDDTGKLIWQKSLGGSAGDFSYSLCETPDGAFIVSGYAYSYDGEAGGGYSRGDYWLVKLDITGRLLWTKKLGGNNEDFGYEITTTRDSGFIIAGYSGSNDYDVSHHRGANDFWIVKLYYPKPSGITETATGNTALAYPNPATDRLILNAGPVPVPYRIADIYGRILLQGLAGPGQPELDISSLLPGTYVLQLAPEYKQLFTVIK